MDSHVLSPHPVLSTSSPITSTSSPLHPAGSTDGGVHVYDLAAPSSSSSASVPGRGAGEGPQPLRTLAGHVASVLSMDLCVSNGSLASGSEDGTVRLWDCRSALGGCTRCV
jgi:WD40 repeat protein